MNYNTSVISKKNILLKRIYAQRYLLSMLFIGVVIVFVFAYIPLAGWLMAFKDYQIGTNLLKSDWVGLENFKQFFLDSSDALLVIRNTLVMNVISLVTILSISCTFAILLNEVRFKSLKVFTQSCTFFPFFISWVIVYSIFYSFLAVNSGAINQLLVSKGVISEGINFLGDPKYSWVLIILVNNWKFVGYNAIIFISSLAGIDQEQYESANIDGASRFQKIRYITIPALIPTFAVMLIMQAGFIFSSNFEEYYLFSNPTNWDVMEVFDIYAYKYGLKLLNFPYSTATSIVKTFVSIAMLLMVNRISKKVTDRGLF